MLTIWWPAFLVPVLMTLGGLLGRWLPMIRYRSVKGALSEAKQRFADNQLRHMLWQFGLAFLALCFMVMNSVRLMSVDLQRWLLYAAIVLEVLGVLLMALPIEKALQTQFDETEDKGDLT